MHSGSDGFVSFDCPYCCQRFKLTTDEVQDDAVINLYCPICGLSNEKVKFISREAMAAAQVMAENLARQAINSAVKDFGRGFGNSKHVKFEPGKPLKMEPEKVLFEDSNLEAVEIKCCRKNVRIRLIEKIVGAYCPYCGLVNSWTTR